MSPRTRTGVGQESMTEIIEAVRPVRHMEVPNNFAQVATPEYFDLDPTKYVDIDQQMLGAATPEKLRPSLIDVHRSAKKLFIVGYTPEDYNKARYVPLYPYEFKLISRTDSPKRYGEIVVAATLSGKKSLLPSIEKQQSEAEEDKIQAIEAKRKTIKEHLDQHLSPEHAMLTRLIEAAEHPGLRRRKEAETRVSVTAVMEWIIPQVLQVVGRNRNWSDEQHDLAKRATEYRLFFMRDGNQHLRNWVDMLKLLRDYDQEKINLFGDRAGGFAGYLKQHGRSTT